MLRMMQQRLWPSCLGARSSAASLWRIRPLRRDIPAAQLHMRCTALTLSEPLAAPAAPAITAFARTPLSQELQSALGDLGLEEPTEVQSTAMPEILAGQDVLLASHTGSGKTLAYLLPIIQLLKQQERAGAPGAKPKRPKVLVLGPTRELTDQILRVAKSLSHHAKFRSACINGGGTRATSKAALAQPIDLLVATPRRVLQHAAEGNMFFGDVQWVVLDEADTMLDKDFGTEVQELLRPLRSKPQPAHCIMVAATLTKGVKKLVASQFPAMCHVQTSTLHKGVAGARHNFLDVPGPDDKLGVLVRTLEPRLQKSERIMVFCNTLPSCRAVEMHLQERGVPTLCYHGDVPLQGRQDAIARFSADTEEGGEHPVLVCTDLAARGLDIPGQVHLIVNFDFPLNPIDYIHRAGRTARAGQRGNITSLVAKGGQVLARRIEEALQKGLPLDELSADRRSLPPHMRPKAETLERRKAERKAERQARRGVRGAARHLAPQAGPASKAASGGRGAGSRAASGGRGAGSRTSSGSRGAGSKTPSYGRGAGRGRGSSRDPYGGGREQGWPEAAPGAGRGRGSSRGPDGGGRGQGRADAAPGAGRGRDGARGAPSGGRGQGRADSAPGAGRGRGGARGAAGGGRGQGRAGSAGGRGQGRNSAPSRSFERYEGSRDAPAWKSPPTAAGSSGGRVAKDQPGLFQDPAARQPKRPLRRGRTASLKR